MLLRCAHNSFEYVQARNLSGTRRITPIIIEKGSDLVLGKIALNIISYTCSLGLCSVPFRSVPFRSS